MAEFYNTITNQSDGSITVVQNMSSPCNTSYPTLTMTATAAVPTSAVRSFEPYSFLHAVKPYDRSQKWSQIKKSGIIKMTPYFNRKIEMYDYLAQVDRNSYAVNYNGTKRCCPSGWITRGPWTVDAHSSWTEQGDLSYWRSAYPLIPFYQATVGASSSEIEKAKTDVWNEMLNGYDLLTELAELKQTTSEIARILRAVRDPLASFIKAKQALRNPKDIAKLWLEYRYAIMPLVYSIKDILKLSKTKGLYYSARSKIYGSVSDPDLPSSGSCFYESVSGWSTTSLVAKAHWSSSALQSVDRVSINPFTTAWELIPYSFVIDWFANVGDFISSYIRSYTTAADQKIGCISNRQKYQKDTYLRLKLNEEVTFSFAERTHGTCHSAPSGIELPAASFTRGNNSTVVIHLRREDVDEYTRSLFDNHDLKLAFSPYLDWKRLLDALALSVNPFSQALRRLKK